MTKLTKEQVKFFIETMTDDMHNTTQHKIAETLLSKFGECESLQAKLLAYEQAAEKPYGYLEPCDFPRTTATVYPEKDKYAFMPLYTAPVLPKQPDVTLTNDGGITKIIKAAEKLVRCKGRYHSEQNYRALAALFGVTVPDLPPLPSDEAPAQPELPQGFTYESGILTANFGNGDVLISDTHWPESGHAGISFAPAPQPKRPNLSDYTDLLGGSKTEEIGTLFIVKSNSAESLIAIRNKLDIAINALSPAPAQPVIPEQIEPAAWRCDKEGTKGVVITVHKQVADSWILKGWKVTPLIEANQSQPVSEPYKLAAIPDGWVACSERMPEPKRWLALYGARVFTHDDKSGQPYEEPCVDQGYLGSDGKFYLLNWEHPGILDDSYNNDLAVATHWMYWELPEPPMQESE